MRYTFSLTRGGAIAVASGAALGTVLVFAAGLLVGASAAAPREHVDALLPMDSAQLAAEVKADSAAADSAAALPEFQDCPSAEAASFPVTEGTGVGSQAAFGWVPPATGGPDPYAPDDADGRTMGTFRDETQALALMRRIDARGTPSFIDARLGPDGAPVFRVRTGDPEEAP
jgi:hypothetical protein